MVISAFASPMQVSLLTSRNCIVSKCSSRSFSGAAVACNSPKVASRFTACFQSPVNLPNNGTKSQPVKFAPVVKEGTHVHLTPEFEKKNKNYHLSTEGSRDGGSISFDRVTYNLAQLHMHAPSENRLDDREFSVEMHLVHKSNDGQTCVLGIFFDEGQTNAEFENILHALETKTSSNVNIVKLLGLGLNRAQLLVFQGSLTTPDFDEGVQWLVSKDVPHISPEQYQRFKKIMGIKFPNARKLQDLNGREIISYYG